jgi:predicted nucleotidyltransferase component of viral defense system
MRPDLHKRPSEMRAAIEFTAAETGFALHLIEKDYWCSMLLKELFEMSDMPLVFKGGTLLSKAFAVFERLSEDLDLTIPTPSDVSRGQRRMRAAKVRDRLENLVDRYDLRWEDDWRGHNQSRHYTARVKYPSIYRGTHTILIEVSQREEPSLELISTKLETLLLDPMHGETVVEPFDSIALKSNEA